MDHNFDNHPCTWSPRVPPRFLSSYDPVMLVKEAIFWVAVKELIYVSDSTTMLFTIYPYYGNLNYVP